MSKGAYLLFSLFILLGTSQIPGANGILLETYNAGMKLLEHLLNPPRLFLQDRDEYRLPDFLIKQSGYPLEVHEVETPDGYVLTVYRIPHGKRGNSTKEPVMIMPGVYSSASTYFVLSAEKALPFILADAGHDVWVGNYRGCEATRHKMYSRKNLKFWLYSLDHIVKYDVISIMDHVLKTTNRPTISYVGHSLGTTMFFMAMASHPSYNQKVRKMVGMAPGCYATYTESLLTLLKNINLGRMVAMMDVLFAGETPLAKARESISTALLFCRLIRLPRACMRTFKGFETSGFNMTVWIRATKHFPTSVSARTLAQIGSIIRNGKCQMYDFGKDQNKKHYGTDLPPLYNLEKVTAPIMAMYGLHDEVITPRDTKKTVSELGNKESFAYEVPRSNFTHSDFVLHDQVKPLVYDKVVEYFNSA